VFWKMSRQAMAGGRPLAASESREVFGTWE
jgi:hypothetical protein